eukprot:scaffold12145_cov16-Tisochrysis_lutea.AAC.1
MVLPEHCWSVDMEQELDVPGPALPALSMTAEHAAGASAHGKRGNKHRTKRKQGPLQLCLHGELAVTGSDF